MTPQPRDTQIMSRVGDELFVVLMDGHIGSGHVRDAMPPEAVGLPSMTFRGCGFLRAVTGRLWWQTKFNLRKRTQTKHSPPRQRHQASSFPDGLGAE